MNTSSKTPDMMHFGKVLALCIVVFFFAVLTLLFHGCIDDANPQQRSNYDFNVKTYVLPPGKKLISFSLAGGPLFVTEDMEPGYTPKNKTIYGVNRRDEVNPLIIVNEIKNQNNNDNE